MNTKTETPQVLTMGLRESLKMIMKDEIERLPEMLEQLDPKERLNIVCKLMPYVFPKVESVSTTQSDPWQVDY